jgi:hypothetical protein
MIGEILWPVAFVVGVYRFSQAIELFSPERIAKLKEVPSPANVPEDLVALALQENEPWAQEEVMRAVREKYEDLGDWNAVRSAMGIGRID